MPDTFDEKQKQLDERDTKISENLLRMEHRIVVFSGKGGVGKTTVSVNLAFALSQLGHQVGLLDADVTGPNIQKMLGITNGLRTKDASIVPHNCEGVRVVSMAGILPPDQPVIWRGPLRSRLLHQFLGDVEWGSLDYLVADLPPGTGDEIITMTQRMKPDMAVVVTTPQEVSLLDCARAITMARKMEIKHIGVIENMSELVCPDCGTRIDLFGSGGGKRLADRMQVGFLGTLPFDLETRKSSDEGRPIIRNHPFNEVAMSIMYMVREIQAILLEERNELVQ